MRSSFGGSLYGSQRHTSEQLPLFCRQNIGEHGTEMASVENSRHIVCAEAEFRQGVQPGSLGGDSEGESVVAAMAQHQAFKIYAS